jgi:hypothetical protein
VSLNRLLSTGFITAIVGAVALSAGAWFYHQQAEEAKLLNAELQQTKLALDESTQQARDQTQALNDAVKNSEQYQQAQKTQSRRVTLLMNGLNAMNSVKVAVAESYMTYLKWPQSNKEAGVPEPESFKTESVVSINVQPGGKIRLRVINPEGRPERLWLNGSVNAAMQVLWKCTTEDIPDIAQLIPVCVYNGK